MFCWVKFGYILPMCELLFCVVFSFNSSSLDMKSSHAYNNLKILAKFNRFSV